MVSLESISKIKINVIKYVNICMNYLGMEFLVILVTFLVRLFFFFHLFLLVGG